LGLLFTAKHFEVNVQTAKNFFQNLGEKGARINIYDRFHEAFFNANIKWFLGINAHEQIQIIRNFINVDTGLTSDVSLH